MPFIKAGLIDAAQGCLITIGKGTISATSQAMAQSCSPKKRTIVMRAAASLLSYLPTTKAFRMVAGLSFKLGC